MNGLVIVQDNQVVTSSRRLAHDFGKRHDNIIRDIEGLLNFEDTPDNLFLKTTYNHPQNKQAYPEYLMNRDGFTLLVMGFTGSKALHWKLKYIAAFNEMEQQLRNRPSSDDVLQNKLRIFKELSRDCTTKQQIRMRIVALKETQAETGKDYSEVIEILSEKPDPPILVNTVTPDKIQRVLEIIRNTESIGTVSNGYIYIESSEFTRLMVKMGYDRRLILKRMWAMGLLRIGMDGSKRYTIKKRMNGCILSCVAIKWE